MKLYGPGWPDRAGWYAIGLFVQTTMILWMCAYYPELRQDEFFKNLATAIVVTGWIGFAVGQAKGDTERNNTAKALEVAKQSAPVQTENMAVTADRVTVEKDAK